jgi:hypothetical protein
MKRRFTLVLNLFLVMGLAFTACETTDDDACSNELGDIGPDYNCTVPVMPQICTVDGVDDHWILDGVEYACPNGDCTEIPAALVEAIRDKDGCASKKSVDLKAVNMEISKRAAIVLANLKMESVLCSN